MSLRSIEAMYALDKHELEEITAMKPYKSGFGQKQSNAPAPRKHTPRDRDPVKEKLRQERMQQAMDRLARMVVRGGKHG